MNVSFRFAAACALALSLSCAKKNPDEPSATGGGDGGGSGGSGGGGGGGSNVTQDALHMASYPLKNSVTNSPWNYHAVLSEPGEAEWAVVEAPTGAVISASGVMTWMPTAEQKGTQNFLIRATQNGTVVEQRFEVDVTHFEISAQTSADPADPNGSSLTVDAPLSPVRGSGVVISPGSIPGDMPVELTISEVSNPPIPLTAQLSGIAEADLRPVEFGPSGLTFTKPITIYLPLSDAMKERTALEIQTYDFTTGQWERVPVLSIDREHGVAAAQVSHFSLYTVTPTTTVFSVSFTAGGAACANTAFVKGTLSLPFSSIPAGTVNGYTGTASSLSQVITGLAEGESVQALMQLNGSAGAANAGAWTMASATRNASGNFTVNVVSSDHPAAYLAIPADIAEADVESWLNGSRFHSNFASFASLSSGMSVKIAASLYFLGAGSDATQPPQGNGNVLGQEETFEAQTLTSVDGYDSDCDGAPDAIDSTPQGDPPPSLTVSPESPIQLIVGEAFNLKAVSDGTLNWQSSNTALTVTPTADGASITASVVGSFRVMVETSRGSGSRTYSWEVSAEQRAAANTPPVVAIAVSPSLTIREGEVVSLSAVGKDSEQSPSRLNYRWSTLTEASLSAAVGEGIRFIGQRPGDFRISCIANDGFADSAETSIVISVLPLAVNRPPEPPLVTPVSALLQHASGDMVELKLVANSRDPDGDAVAYQFDLEAGHPDGASFTQAGDNATFTAFNDGVYVVYIRAVDDKGLSGPTTRAKIQVVPTIAAQPVDADRDGSPSTSDCNDADPLIFPGAREVCGDNVDQDCSGADLGASSCDRDGDRYSPDQGDCDDMNPGRNPGLIERCDGIDNNCDGNIDESFGINADCSVGVGACRSSGKTACNASRSSTTCSAMPGRPSGESCNGIDDNCNGAVDDVTIQSGDGDVNNCGGCGVVCMAPPNMMPRCFNGGCATSCTAGFVDADRNPANGCECRPNVNAGGKEICNGLDDDCNGFVDENTAQQFYTGPTGTKGIGECLGGLSVCVNGALVVREPERLPRAEQCDGRDNNCDGKVDESFPLQQDPANCGACGRACGANQGCFAGQCKSPDVDGGLPPSCGPDRQLCAGMCVDTRFNPENCGMCGKSCGAGNFCDQGACKQGDTGGMPCPQPALLCQIGTASYCSEIGTDPLNCGACGFKCGNGQVCNSGQCVAPNTPSNCASEALTCSNGNYCAWAFIDPINCGACGKKCPAGNACMSGQCRPDPRYDGTMPCGPLNQCGLMCTDFNEDPWNCGSCGKSCQSGENCRKGLCVNEPDCGPNQLSCSDATGKTYCTDPKFDRKNCGGCNQACAQGDSCSNGQCQPRTDGGSPSCGPGGIECSDPRGGNYCTDPSRDPLNCGGCGRACGTAESCLGGQCEARNYPDGGLNCGDGMSCTDASGKPYCVDSKFDPRNCGACGKACGSGEGCFEGQCQSSTLPDGGPNCGGGLSCTDPNGKPYCTDPKFDPMNCGGCGQACAPGDGCSNGQCQPRPDGGNPGCGPGGMSCSTPNGGSFCTDPAKDPKNCGGCGKVCQVGDACFNGQCQPSTLPDGGQNCGGGGISCTDATGKPYCTDPKFDPMNCGGCGQACPPDNGCSNGVCQPRPDGGTGNCGPGGMSCSEPNGGTYCTDPSRDPMNCGECHKACGPNESCFGGQCQSSTLPDGGMNCGGGLACNDATGKPFCADQWRDSMNCGSCGHACSPSEGCYGGECMPGPSCGPGGMACTSPTGGVFCIDPARDPMNCGGCGNACTSGDVCFSGQCQPSTLPDGGQNCGNGLSCLDPSGKSYCADIQYDPKNCGDCGHACAAGESCFGGACKSVPDGGTTGCGPGGMSCTNSAGGSFCVDPQHDPMNCGGCGYVCAQGTGCSNGFCQQIPDGGPINNCMPGAISCKDMGGNDFCTDPTNDSMNCGGCGRQCAMGSVCSNANCQFPTLPDGGLNCGPSGNACQNTQGPYCTEFSKDPRNCGGCGQLCTAGTGCLSGTCVPDGTDGGSCQSGTNRLCYTGPNGTRDVGICRAGTQACTSLGFWDNCSGQQLPVPEMCGNGQDEDCDGVVDQPCPLAIAPGTLMIMPSSGFSFTGQSGKPPFAWTLSTNQSGGNVNDVGRYTSGALVGNDVVRVTDNGGGVAEAFVSVVENPSVTLMPSGGRFRDTTLNVFVRTVAGATLTATVDGNPISVPPLNSDGTGNLMVPLQNEGPHVLSVTVSANGKTGSASADYVLDLTPPAVPVITSPLNKTSVLGPTIVASGSADSNVLIELFEPGMPTLGSVSTGAASAFSITTPPLVIGQHLLMAHASDEVGNHSPPSSPVEVMVTNGTPGPLSAHPAPARVSRGGAIKFFATGGKPPYSWSTVSLPSGGSITSTGDYNAGPTAANDMIRLVDTSGGSPLDVQVMVGP